MYIQNGTGRAGYHESTRGAISEVCFAPGSCDQLRGSPRQREERRSGVTGRRRDDGRRGTLYCYRFPRHAYLTPAFFALPPFLAISFVDTYTAARRWSVRPAPQRTDIHLNETRKSMNTISIFRYFILFLKDRKKRLIEKSITNNI